MKKFALIILAVSLFLSISSIAFADDTFQLIGREIYAGVELGDGTVTGALFIGEFFDNAARRGYFSINLDHNGQGVERCLEQTAILGFRLTMYFNSGARLVLKKPDDVSATADWFWDDPYYPDGGVFLIDYNSYIQNNLSSLVACNIPIYGGNPSTSFIASVDSFDVTREKLGSYGLRNYRAGEVEGLLVHTPFISPAIFGTVTLGR